MTSFASSDIWLAFIMTLVAAISTFMGAMTSLYFRKVNQVTLSVILGFAAGIMIYTAFMKLMPDSISILSSQLSYAQTKITSTVWFFVGIVLLYPLGYLVLLTITAHSFVEGLATFLSFLATPLVAIPLVLSIIVHNFPEGMTIGALFNKISDSMNRRRAIFYSVIASLFEPIGALMAYIFILKYSNPVLTGILKAFLSGLLVATALNELIPNSQLKGNRKVSVQSIILGMFIMGVVLVSASIF